jgi:hypothetical protein
MLVRLKVKLAEMVNGLDLSHCDENDVVEVSQRDGEMLIAERWGESVAQDEMADCRPKRLERAVAADEGYRGWRKAKGASPGPGHEP